MYLIIHISPWKMIKNITPSCLASIVMAGAAFMMLQVSNNIAYQLATTVVCVIVYFAVIYAFPKERKIILDIKNKYCKRKQ